MYKFLSYKECFAKSFMLNIEDPQIEHLEYQGIRDWDSVGHMALIATIEDGFGVMLDMEDVIGFSSYKTGITILAKYDIEFS